MLCCSSFKWCACICPSSPLDAVVRTNVATLKRSRRARVMQKCFSLATPSPLPHSQPRASDCRVLFCVFVLHDNLQRELVCERAPPPRHFVSLSYLFCNPSLTLPLQVLATFAHSVSRQTSHSTMHIMSCVCVFFFFLHFTFNRTKSQSR